MKRHIFVTQSEQQSPRWREAFPHLRQCRTPQVCRLVQAGDHVWLMEQVEEWPTLVRSLVRQGAVVVVLSYSPTSGVALKALEAGARGYAHALSPAALLQQIALVTEHQGIWVGPELLAQVVGTSFRALGGVAQVRDDVLSVLTERERSVALHVASGKSNKEVARTLEITERTVKAHLGSIFRKLNVRDRMQLILMISRRAESAIEIDS
ncbi:MULTISPECIES: response regulator transcription factor [Halomonadaceae]|uniref:response regulator transcription factor n=1 Tax=Halomonadaceae TaxID=28256 RepID=UPI00159AE599|nr:MULTISPECIES: response regulator transcription factor [Halomonas]QJQ94141.1 response regulator transcription factor [Halomonas sp. PA5]